MDRVALGATSETLSRVVFGCAAMGGHDYGVVDDNQSVRAVYRALDLGIDAFDTADVYGFGHAEEVLGRALRGQRQRAFIATKVGVAFEPGGKTRRDLAPARIALALEASLRRLQTDVIDLYQIHWPDPARPLVESLSALADLQRAGKVRRIGVCNAVATDLTGASSVCRMETVQETYNIADWLKIEPLRALIDAERWTPLTYNSLGQGLLSGKYGRDMRFKGHDRRQRSGYFAGGKHEAMLATAARVSDVAQHYGRTSAQTAVRWILDSLPRSCAIVGMKTAAQVEDIAGATGWSLAPNDVEFLREQHNAAPVST